MKRQMAKLHQKHIDLGYIEPPEYERIRKPYEPDDWLILYKPGRRAREEYKRNRQRRVTRPKAKELPAEEHPDTAALNLVWLP